MGKIAFVFPGQGSQTVGMGKTLAESENFARAYFDKKRMKFWDIPFPRLFLKVPKRNYVDSERPTRFAYNKRRCFGTVQKGLKFSPTTPQGTAWESIRPLFVQVQSLLRMPFMW